MKTRYGAWVDLPDTKTIEVFQIRDYRFDGSSLYLYTVGYPEDKRALDDTMIEITVTAPSKNVFRIEAVHFAGVRKKQPQFELNIDNLPMELEKTDTSLTLINGMMRLEISKNPAYFDFYYGDRYLTSLAKKWGRSYLSYVTAKGKPYMSAHLSVDVDEKLYGLGERFTPFVKNGQTVDLWNEDGGTCTEISYKNVPFLLSSRGYGVFVNNPGPVSYEICSEHVSRAEFAVPGEKLDFMIIGGESMKDAVSSYCAMSGYPALPPSWSFGLWLTSSFTTSYDENTVTSFVNGMKERGIPLSVFHYDCFWMKENEWCNFTWDKAMFPDPENMLKRMKEKGLHICVWINPYIGQKSPLFKEAMENDFLINRENGDVWQWDKWQSGMGIVDFTNPRACKWYQDKLRTLIDMGVDCFKTDFGERIPTDVSYFDKSDATSMHNYYTYLYNKCVFELLESEKGEGNAVLFARSATAGGQKFPVHWGGDCTSDYQSMAESLRGGLSLCMSGFSFWSHDIGGFQGTASHDLYKRWVAFGLLSTHSRLHGDSSYRVPWLFSKEGEENGEEACAVTKHFSELKCSLMPYIFASAVASHKTGIPTMRPMVLEFTEDNNTHYLDKQYMLGDSIMVAPVFRENGEADYYLPKGKWTHLLTNETRLGEKWYKDTYDFFSLPLYVRENTVLPIGGCSTRPDYSYQDGVTLHIFELNTEAKAVIYDEKGKNPANVSVIRKENKITVKIDKHLKNVKILLRNIPYITSVSCNEAESVSLGTLIPISEKETVITL